MNLRFGQKNPGLLPESWKLKRNMFFELFSGYLDEKNDLGGLQKRTKQKTERDSEKSR